MSAQFSRRKISGNVSLSLMPSTTAAVSRDGSTPTWTDVAAFARDRLDEEAAHRVVADTRYQARLQAEARAAERRVRRRSAEILCEGRHVLEACADLLRVEIDAEAAETQDVVRTAFREARSVLHKSQYMQFPKPRPAWICFRGAVCRRSRC